MSSRLKSVLLTVQVTLSVATLSLAALGGRPANGPVPRLPWLHEGLMLTYTWYAAVAPGNGSYYEENENGDFILHSTGQRYTRMTQTGTSGRGWSQITVACIEGDRVVLASSSYADAGSLGRNAPVPQGSTSTVGPVADPGDYWMDPAKLATLRTGATENMGVTHVAWRVADKTVDAVRVQIVHALSYSDHIYDAKTGLLIHEASSSQGAPPKLVGPGDFGRGDTTLTHNDFVSARDLSIPWAGETIPDTIANIRALHYRGSMTSHGPLPTVPNALSLDLQTVAKGHGWMQFSGRSAERVQGAPEIPPASIDIAFGLNEFGGLWIMPEALAQLRQGQVLDEDPITKMRTIVSRVDDSSVVIVSSNAAGEIDNQYDKRTGMLIGSSFYNVLSMQQRAYKLQGRE